ncbi:MAG: hypothetical protein IT222_12590 [Crocinitomix sp.]|nr:hypothetical protein [Crocinitomix sp.]
MLDKFDFIKNFNGLAIPDELAKLLDFQNNISKENFYSAGFELTVVLEKFGLRTYSEDLQFLNSILEFAHADGTGSSYGFWLNGSKQDLKETPIVIFGSEGGFHIVARNIQELLQILTYDAEPMVSWDEVYYYKDEGECEPSDLAETFKKWLFDNFKIREISNVSDIIRVAQSEYQEEFKTWMKKFYTG